MVIPAIVDGLLFAQLAERKVPEPTRTIILMALLGILLLGMLLIVGTLLLGHWVRRQGHERRGPVVPPDVILPRTAPPQRPVSDRMQSANSSETFSGDDTVGTDDTVVS